MVGRPRPVARSAQAASDIVAHELRTPLTSLVLGSRLLLHGAVRGRPRRSVVLDLVVETQRLADAVEDLLVLAGVGSEQLPPEPVSLQHVVRAELAQAAATEPLVRFRALLPADVPPVLADDADIRHLVHDLVASGVARASDGGIVEATLGQVPKASVRLRVSGTGARAPGHAGERSPAVLREAALRVLAGRLGASLLLATGPRRLVGQVMLPAAWPPRGGPAVEHPAAAPAAADTIGGSGGAAGPDDAAGPDEAPAPGVALGRAPGAGRPAQGPAVQGPPLAGPVTSM